jgi:hypothetical protein
MDRRLIDASEAGLIPQNGATQSMIRESCELVQDPTAIFWIVKGFTDFLQHYPFFKRQVFGPQMGLQHEVCRQTKRKRRIIGKATGEKACPLVTGCGIKIDPTAFSFFSEGARIAPTGTLEHQMFQEMSNAIFAHRLRPRARFYPNTNAGAGEAGDRVHQEADAIGEGL